MSRLPWFVRDDRGVTAVEYALYVFFVALGLFVAIGTFNGAIAGVLTSTADDPVISGTPPTGLDQCEDLDADDSDDGEDTDGDGDDDDGFLDDSDDSGDTGDDCDDDGDSDDTEDDGDSEDNDSGDEEDED